jgi:DNA polymerase
VYHAIAAKRIIDMYRSTAHPVVTFWHMCSDLIERSLYDGQEFVYKCLTFRKGEIELPNGMKLLYPNLRIEKDEDGRSQWVYGPDATKLYAGKVTNNVTQALARIVMTDGMLRVSQRYPVVGTVHDELIALVADDEVDEAKTWVLAQMTMEPRYMPGIPLDADGGAHRRYGLAKN